MDNDLKADCGSVCTAALCAEDTVWALRLCVHKTQSGLLHNIIYNKTAKEILYLSVLSSLV